MGGMDVLLELILVGLLGATLLHAVRLQRSLAALRQDRAALDAAATGFDGGAREAEAALVRLRAAAEQVEAQLRSAIALKDDLVFLSDRGEQLADQLDALVRAGKGMESAFVPPPPASPPAGPSASPAPRSQAERSLLLALQARR